MAEAEHPEGSELEHLGEESGSPTARVPAADSGTPTVPPGSNALGALAVGAVAFGALAIGAVAIGRLFIRRAQIRSLRIDRLEIGELVVRNRVAD